MTKLADRRDGDTFVPEQFCDEVYDYVDDNLAEAMDEMEKELLKSLGLYEADVMLLNRASQAVKQKTSEGARDGRGNGNESIEKLVKTCCDNVQKVLQKEFDRNLDIFDRYVKKNASAAVAAARQAASLSSGQGVGKAGATVAAAAKATESIGESEPRGTSPADSPRGEATRAVWDFEVEEGTAPKRLQDEEELDEEIKRLRKRRREGLRRCAAMVRKGAREKTVLNDVNDYVEALQMGVSNSFDDNGLTPVPAKVQEAVQSSAALRVTADRAQELARRLERELQARAAGAGSRDASSVATGARPPPRDLQDVFQRSSEHIVVTESVTEYSALGARLRG